MKKGVDTFLTGAEIERFCAVQRKLTKEYSALSVSLCLHSYKSQKDQDTTYIIKEDEKQDGIVPGNIVRVGKH